MIRTTYNQNEDAFRLAELNYIRRTRDANEAEDQRLSNTMRNFAVVKRQFGQTDDALEKMLESVKNCKGQDYQRFVEAHSASIIRAVQARNPAERRGDNKSDFMKHYKLVKKIGGVDID